MAVGWVIGRQRHHAPRQRALAKGSGSIRHRFYVWNAWYPEDLSAVINRRCWECVSGVESHSTLLFRRRGGKVSLTKIRYSDLRSALLKSY
jgi:hypothetical protein